MSHNFFLHEIPHRFRFISQNSYRESFLLLKPYSRIRIHINLLRTQKLTGLNCLKGIESVISSDPICKEDNVRFTTVPFKPLTVRRVKRAFCLNILKTTWILVKCNVRCVQFDFNSQLSWFLTTFISRSFKGNRCESAIFAWRVTCNYVYSSFIDVSYEF